jgi:hypothetical protein
MVAVALALVACAATSEMNNNTKTRLTVEQVLQLASKTLDESGANITHFKADTPEYIIEKHIWEVFFIQEVFPAAVDGDFLVIVDDTTSKTCVKQVLAVGTCTQ